jgi:hypothetical protein
MSSLNGHALQYAKMLLRQTVSRRTLFRGGAAQNDGLITLLTVDFHATPDAVRLIRSFRKFVAADGPVVVVQNGSTHGNSRLREAGARVVNHGLNLGHGLGLDLGMRQVRTEYTLICDPDSAIIGAGFAPEMVGRTRRFGAAAVDNGCTFYHPICLMFRSERWKTTTLSFEERWHKPPYWDVAGELTHMLGGLKHESLIPRTRCAGPALSSGRTGTAHYYGDVFGDVFTNTYCVSRKVFEPDRHDFDGWSREELDRYQTAWRAWIGAILDDRATVEDFPTGAVRTPAPLHT